MSIKMMTRVWQVAPCRGTELLVLLALSDYANDEGICWPNPKTLATKARCTEQYARKAVHKFEGCGVVSSLKADVRGEHLYVLNLGTSELENLAILNETEFRETEFRETELSSNETQAQNPVTIEPSKEPPLSRAGAREDTSEEYP